MKFLDINKSKKAMKTLYKTFNKIDNYVIIVWNINILSVRRRLWVRN